jgi:RimJ/RimL family protein N-acetyltransferase
MIFNPPISLAITHFKTHEAWQMFSIDSSFTAQEQDFLRIKEICNEPLVYRWLFEEMLDSKPYSLEKAKSFISWAQEGWEEQTYFVFLIRDEKGVIQAAIDIKSNNLDESEIGYWASRDKPGIMTNAVRALCGLAKQAGYNKLFADVQVANNRSVKVLKRANFSLEKDFIKNGERYYRYWKELL